MDQHRPVRVDRLNTVVLIPRELNVPPRLGEEAASSFAAVPFFLAGEGKVDRLPGVTFAAIATDSEGTKKILNAFEWVIERVRLAG